MRNWIGVDLDGTLAHFEPGQDLREIGAPIPVMVERVKRWLSQGYEVRIFTARAADPIQVRRIERWSDEHIGQRLMVTNIKDFGMVEVWDDRAVGVIPNSGYPHSWQSRIPERRETR